MKKFKLTLIILLLSFLLWSPAQAQSLPGIYQPFGGRIILTTPCTCSWNFLITLIPPPGVFPPMVIYRPGLSILYAHYNFMTPGVAVLGLALGVDTCWQGIFPFCIPDPRLLSTGGFAPRVHLMGTSLVPAI